MAAQNHRVLRGRAGARPSKRTFCQGFLERSWFFLRPGCSRARRGRGRAGGCDRLGVFALQKRQVVGGRLVELLSQFVDLAFEFDHALFAPDSQAMYPAGFQTRVSVTRLPDHLCGLGRPGHFDGVAQVVLKLFHLCLPDVAVFGRKDFQQLRVIERMVRDLDVPVRIVGHPTVREPDGLALSSRNRYLSPAERRLAPLLHETLQDLASEVRGGARDVRTLVQDARARLDLAGFRVEYLNAVDPDTLDDLAETRRPLLFAIAARLGSTRLIDNELVD